MSQELEYLRAELNQLCSYWTDHVSKTINTVLLIWGGSLAFLGYNTKPTMETNLDNIPAFFILATIFLFLI